MIIARSRSRVVGVALVALVFAAALFLFQTGRAYATHCYVADKPDGAGIGGAFMDGPGGQDVFVGDLPEPAHMMGSADHGVQELD